MSERTENGKSKIIPSCPGIDEWWYHKIMTGRVLHKKESNLEQVPFEMRNEIRIGGSEDLD